MERQTFAEALAVLSSSSVLSSSYYILAGADGHGAIVTRFGNASSVDVWPLGAEGEQPAWMRVQTNVDHWVSADSGAYATQRRQRVVDLLAAAGPSAVSREALLDIYLTDQAKKGAENRTRPEDTGVILRPTTIATIIFDPSSRDQALDPRYWRIWSSSPKIRPPARSEGQDMLGVAFGTFDVTV